MVCCQGCIVLLKEKHFHACNCHFPLAQLPCNWNKCFLNRHWMSFGGGSGKPTHHSCHELWYGSHKSLKRHAINKLLGVRRDASRFHGSLMLKATADAEMMSLDAFLYLFTTWSPVLLQNRLLHMQSELIVAWEMEDIWNSWFSFLSESIRAHSAHQKVKISKKKLRYSQKTKGRIILFLVIACVVCECVCVKPADCFMHY